ncbi:MAG TPA: polysaccharide deacetylase family protein [Tepidisphaeraceae bacterium]|nr:polysaccharide deacetylase family protein [Tepidisphaeraceae bacterium]
MKNALSIDFEDWFQPFAARNIDGWQQYPSRVPSDTKRLLTVLAKYNVRCTFFVLGEVAEKFPEEIRAIHRAGHEIGSHGYRHLPLFKLQPDEFEKEMRQSLDFLKQLTGEPVLGFRAPFFSIRKDSLWAIDSLRKLGLQYDTSINPIAGAFHGYRDGGRFPYTHSNGLKEFPITTYSMAGLSIPFGGGMYYRLLPYPVIRAGLRSLNKKNIAGNVYFHPREFDPDLPRLKTGLKMKLIVYAGTKTLEEKLERLLQDFTFIPMREL